MKKALLVKFLTLSLMVLISGGIYAQEVLNGGNMENASAWSVADHPGGAEASPVYTFNYTDDAPAAGVGGSLRIQAVNPGTGTQNVNSLLFQEITLVAGHVYNFTGAFKDITEDNVSNFWCEIGISSTDPGVEDNIEYLIGINTWDGCGVGLDGTFQDDGCKYLNTTITVPAEIEGDTTVYFAMLIGNWNNVVDSFDVLIDELSLMDLGIPEFTELAVANLVDGMVDSPEDFTANARLKWDADSIYMYFEVMDDSVTATASTDIYNNDNIEIYFDINNGKTPQWPRDLGWPPAYTNGSGGFFQFRVVPDSAWSDYNSGLATTANLIHEDIEDGYAFILNIPWDILDADFVPEIGAEIGFDIWASDNDASPNYRNQISWNANNTLIYVDPASWGTLQLTYNGLFNVIADSENPEAPANLEATADTSAVRLTWDAAEDNIVVQNYIVYDGNTVLDTLLALQTGNAYTALGLESGEHTLGVAAADLYWNKSAKATVAATVTGLELTKASICRIFPNPSQGIFSISAESSGQVSVEVFTPAGHLVYSDSFTGNHMVDLTTYTRGLYIVYLRSENTLQVEKLIVK